MLLTFVTVRCFEFLFVKEIIKKCNSAAVLEQILSVICLIAFINCANLIFSKKMGSNTSKPSSDAAVSAPKNDLVTDATSDPRSPTPEISRTPLQGKTGARHNITKNADLRKTFENSRGDEKLIHNNPILSAVIKNHLQSYDPRSPTQDFERTPIIISTKIDELKNDKPIHILHNGGSPCLPKDDSEDNYDSCAEAQESPDMMVPKNLCNGFYDITLNESIKETDEPLGSSTASNEAIENIILHQSAEKPTELLETNFDYVEAVIEQFEDSNEIDHSHYDIVANGEESDLKCVPHFKILDEDPRSPSAGIERTPIVVAAVSADVREENVEQMSDDTLIKVLQNTNADLRQSVVKSTNEGVLIYEDESNDLLNTPKKPKNGSSSGSRTPLSCMKNKTDTGHTRSKSANMLEESKDQQVKARRVSHIPRLKSLCKQTKLMPTGSTLSLKSLSKKSVVSGDCENTPPHSQRDKWDKDNSIVL